MNLIIHTHTHMAIVKAVQQNQEGYEFYLVLSRRPLLAIMWYKKDMSQFIIYAIDHP